MKSQDNAIYIAPAVKIVKIKALAIICDSGGNGSYDEQILDENDFRDE